MTNHQSQWNDRNFKPDPGQCEEEIAAGPWISSPKAHRCRNRAKFVHHRPGMPDQRLCGIHANTRRRYRWAGTIEEIA